MHKDITLQRDMLHARVCIFNAIARRVTRGEMDIDEALLWKSALTQMIESATEGYSDVLAVIADIAGRTVSLKKRLQVHTEGSDA